MAKTIYATQGGGKVIEDGNSGKYVFIESPGICGLEVGDYMPEEWGTVAIKNEPPEFLELEDYMGFENYYEGW